jgi:uncharacterized coiled-coil DUF342 family protein
MATTKELLQARMAELRADVSGILAKTEGMRKERESICAKASEANGKANELTAKIDAIEQPALAEKKAELAAVASALGSLKLNG